jgi:hypothetical protein
MNKYTYIKEKLSLAIEQLALGEKDVRDRLATVYQTLCIIDDRDLPAELQGDWQFFISGMTKYGSIERAGVIIMDAVHNTMRRMQNKTARKFAEIVFNMFWKFVVLKEFDNDTPYKVKQSKRKGIS